MSILTLTYPVQSAVSFIQPFLGSIGGFLRTVLGVGIFGMLTVIAVVSKPLHAGLARVMHVAVNPALAAQQRYLEARVEGANLLNRLAHEADTTQPNLATELRYIAARG
jgi:hypothetical protein